MLEPFLKGEMGIFTYQILENTSTYELTPPRYSLFITKDSLIASSRYPNTLSW